MFHAVPLFTFLRAPSRFGLIVAVRARRVLARLRCGALPGDRAGAPAWSRRRVRGSRVAELERRCRSRGNARSPSRRTTRCSRACRAAPLAEFPFYGERVAFPLHAQYMVLSTTHWMPLVNGYSDHIPQDFREAAFVLDSFPSNDSFAVLQRRRVRYIGVHWDMYGPRADEIRSGWSRSAGTCGRSRAMPT